MVTRVQGYKEGDISTHISELSENIMNFFQQVFGNLTLQFTHVSVADENSVLWGQKVGYPSPIFFFLL